eukprot:3960228-Prymnesium_polylepis.2
MRGTHAVATRALMHIKCAPQPAGSPPYSALWGCVFSSGPSVCVPLTAGAEGPELTRPLPPLVIKAP